MGKILSLIVAILLLTMPLVAAQEIETNAGITPDQGILWGIDVAIEKIIMLLTTKPENKVALGLHIASERLAEIKLMAEQNKIQSMDKAEIERENIIDEVEENAKGLSEEHRAFVAIRLQKHIDKLLEVKEEVPEQAKTGLDTAIEKSSYVLERMRVRTG